MQSAMEEESVVQAFVVVDVFDGSTPPASLSEESMAGNGKNTTDQGLKALDLARKKKKRCPSLSTGGWEVIWHAHMGGDYHMLLKQSTTTCLTVIQKFHPQSGEYFKKSPTGKSHSSLVTGQALLKRSDTISTLDLF